MPPATLVARLEQCTMLPAVAINHSYASSKRPSWMDDF
jgi:hypothetical protein